MKTKIARVFAAKKFNKHAMKQFVYYGIEKISYKIGLELIGDLAEVKRIEHSGVCEKLQAYAYGNSGEKET